MYFKVKAIYGLIGHLPSSRAGIFSDGILNCHSAYSFVPNYVFMFMNTQPFFPVLRNNDLLISTLNPPLPQQEGFF